MNFKDDEILCEKEYKSSITTYFARYVVYSDVPILFSFFGNFGELEDIKNSFKYRDEVVKKSGLDKCNFVEIRDYSGSPDTNRDGRLYIKNYLNNTPSNLKGMIFVGANLLLSIMIRTGMRAMKKKMSIIIAKDTGEALKSVYTILNSFDEEQSLHKLTKKIKISEIKNIKVSRCYFKEGMVKLNKLNPFFKVNNYLHDKDFLELNKAILQLTWFKNSTGEEFIPKTKNKRLNEIFETLLILNNDVNKSINRLNENIADLKLETKKRAEAEEELKAKNIELNKSYDNLKKSQDVIFEQEKLASLGTLSAGIAHEINNPAQAIKFTIESLKLNIKDVTYFVDEIKQLESIEDERKKIDYLNKIVQLHEYLDIDTAVEEMDNVCGSNIESIGRIENIVQSTKRMAYLKTDYSSTNIHTVINDALVLCKNDLKQNVKVNTEFMENLPNISGISQELIQVFINLITNSVYELIEKKALFKKDKKEFQPLITVKTLFIEERNTIKIEFSDNGRGIPEVASKKIFDPFYTTKPQGKGTGLGMSLVYKTLEHHKGKIEVDTDFKDGAKFNIFISVI